MKTVVIACAVLLAGLAGGLLMRPANPAQHLLISQATARPMEGGTAVAYLAIDNRGAPDRLVSVTSPQANATLYSPASVAGVPVPTGDGSLALDAAHIKLSGLDGVENGALIPVTLRFENAGEVNTRLHLSDPAEMGAAQKHGLFGIGDICVVGEGEPAPAITLAVSESAEGYQVQVVAEQFEFSKDLAGLYHVPGMGHGHIYVGGFKLGRLYEPTAKIGALPPGTHEVRVTLNTNDHRAYVVDGDPVTASAVIVVD